MSSGCALSQHPPVTPCVTAWCFPPAVNYKISHLCVLGKLQLGHTRRSHFLVAHEEAELPLAWLCSHNQPHPTGVSGGAVGGRDPTPPLPSRCLSAGSDENQRNKLEAYPPLSYLAEIS